MEEHSRNVDGIREAVANLERRADARFMSLERRLDSLDEKMTRYFVWLVGMQVTTLAAVVAALVGR